jgi:hypothetical protein
MPRVCVCVAYLDIVQVRALYTVLGQVTRLVSVKAVCVEGVTRELNLIVHPPPLP